MTEESLHLPVAHQDRPAPPFWLRFYQALWARRRGALHSIHQMGTALGWLYQRFPLPERVRTITTELAFHSIEHFIVQSDGYQRWLDQQAGAASRLHQLLQRRPALPEPTPVKAPSDAEWQALLAQTPRASEDANVAVIVPVYRGYAETLRCLVQLLTARYDQPFSLCVIDDASPDPALKAKLEKLSAAGHIELLNQPRNQGFVATVNRGMRHYPKQDIVLLNSDTEVYDGWLDRLMHALYAADDIASVSPFSNHAELCSYPEAFSHNPQPLELDYAALDALAAEVGAPHAAELPTTVGFCMAMRRQALDAIGLFDEALFGRGYGEENDWCLRAAVQGWRHMLAANLFVRHHGAVSFSDQKRRELNRSLRRLNRRHPHYRKLVRSFRHEDPLLPHRRALDIARLKRQLQQRPVILMVSHNAGGGTERHINDLTAMLKREGMETLRLSPDPWQTNKVALWHPEVPHTPNLRFCIHKEQAELFSLLKGLLITHMHLHHLHGFHASMPYFIQRMSRSLHCPFDVTIHDYYLACPSINLLFDQPYLDKDPDLAASQQWASRHPTPAGRMPVWQWREQHRLLLEQARYVFTPSKDTAQRMASYFPSVSFTVQAHPEAIVQPLSLAPKKKQSEETMHIAVIGKLVRHKGYDVILALAKDAQANELPILFHVFGEVEKPAALKKTGQVLLHGAYREQEIAGLLTQHACHAALFASVWPETYSYTLSLALQHPLYPVCFDLGAPAERVRQAGWGTILPKEWIRTPGKINQTLLALDITAPPDQTRLTHQTPLYPSLLRDYYRLDPDALQAESDHAPVLSSR